MSEQTLNLKKAKLNPMSELEIRQMYHENEAWKRLLTFMLDENVLLKYRLSEILRHSTDPGFLEKAEDFQSQFVKKDVMISLLRDDVADIGNLLMTNGMEDHTKKVQVHNRLKKLRNNISQVEKQFSKLKLEFNSYMSDKI